MPTRRRNFNSPLRYPGGKGALTNFVKRILLENELVGQEYVEVYAGGAGIGWNLLFDNYVSRIHINDLSIPLFSLWFSVLYYTEELCKKIRDTEITYDEWLNQKRIQSNTERYSVAELGFSTLFLNRTNRSGILGAGVIGGKKQNGKWKLDARFNKLDLISRIQKIAQYSSKVNIYNLDAELFISTVLPRLSKELLVYLDPPYYYKGKGLYADFYNHDDHVRISKLVLKKIRQNWILSYDNCSEILKMYGDGQRIDYGIVYTAQKKYSGSEVMYFSKDLKIPSVIDPAKVRLPGVTKNAEISIT